MARGLTDYLPLKTDVFLILIALSEGESYGYALMEQVHALSGGGVALQAGALYRRLRWLLEEGLIEELEERPVVGEDERRRYYALTGAGRRVARAEARRMRELTELAAARRLGREDGR
jgi:DNA-binding PadR family transcriptional regulator